jgi:hypothetical protein
MTEPIVGKTYHITREDCCLTVDVVGTLLEYDPGDWGNETFKFDFGTVTGTRIRLEVQDE